MNLHTNDDYLDDLDYEGGLDDEGEPAKPVSGGGTAADGEGRSGNQDPLTAAEELFGLGDDPAKPDYLAELAAGDPDLTLTKIASELLFIRREREAKAEAERQAAERLKEEASRSDSAWETAILGTTFEDDYRRALAESPAGDALFAEQLRQAEKAGADLWMSDEAKARLADWMGQRESDPVKLAAQVAEQRQAALAARLRADPALAEAARVRVETQRANWMSRLSPEAIESLALHATGQPAPVPSGYTEESWGKVLIRATTGLEV